MAASRDDGIPVVTIIDDDSAVGEALQSLFRSVGLDADLFASVQEFRTADRPDRTGCLVLDVRLPGQSGLDFYESLVKAEIRRPVVFISGHADIPMSVRAMKAGAVEFLVKPVRDQDLIDAVQIAIARDRARRETALGRAAIEDRYATLTPREREIMAMVVAGHRNKRIAVDLGVGEATVKFHRGHLMRKMRAGSVADLVRMADALGMSRG